MSKKIDERVVEMRFDNKQFESGVQTSMSTLDKLKQKLQLKDASTGLDNLGTAVKKVDFNPLSKAAETVTAKFSALQVAGVTAMANITNSAVNAGKNIVKAFTIDPIKMGLEEYETQINAVQTILANTSSKGTTLDQVNNALDELNHYADMTIYNFTEMTRNIGTFTAAGVDLDTSVSSIKGIANLAAVSGSTSLQASTAMYQLSQAIAAGKVQLMDWNSVVNAGMGGQVFQDALKRTAKAHGTDVDELIKKYGSFRETLTETGWLTTEVLTETLETFTGDLTKEELLAKGYTEDQTAEILKMGKTANDAATKVKTFTQLMDTLKEAAQSGWTQTWEILIGDFEEAKELWTGVSDTLSEMLNKSAETRNNMLQGWKDAGGRTMLVDSLKNAFEGLMNIITPIKDAFREIFPPTTSEQLLTFTERIRDLSAKFKEFTENYAPQIKSTFKGIFSVIKVGVTIIKSITSGIVTLIGKLAGFSGGILNISSSFGNWVSGMAKGINETNLFGKAINKIVGFLSLAIDKFKEFTGAIKEKVSASGFEWFFNLMQGIWNVIQKVGSAIGKVAAAIGGALANAFQNGDFKSLLDILNGGIFATILLGIKKYITGITDKFDDTVGIVDKIKDVLGSVEDSLKSWQQNLQSGTIKNIAIAIGILAASLWVLSGIDSDKMGTALGGIGVLMGELMGAMWLFTKITGDAKAIIKGIPALIAMSVAVLILASSLKMLSDLRWEQLTVGLTGVLGLMAILVGAAKILSTGGKKIQKGAMQMVIMAAALKILASVCKDLSELSWEQLGKGVSGIAGILLAFAGFQALMKKIQPKKMLSSALSLVLIGTAMKLFADVANKFGQMKWGDLGKAEAAIAGILAIAAGFGKLSSYAGKMMSSSMALVIIGAAMEIFADVANKFGQMKWQDLGKAGAAIGGILALASGFVLLSGLASGMMKSVISLTIMAAAMEIFADVANKFGQMDWEALGKAGVAIGGILALAAGFSALAGLTGGMLTSAAALLVMAAALAIFTPIMMTLGNMSWGSIVKGLVAIAGAFAIVGVAGAVLGPLVPAILAVSGAIALLGVACLAAGAGIALFATGFTALAAAGAAGAVSFVAAITTIIIGILNLIPSIVDQLTAAIVAICNVIIQSAPAIGEALLELVKLAITVIGECVPQIAEAALQLLIKALELLVQYTPQILDLVVNFLLAVINGLAARIPELVGALAGLIVTIIDSLAAHVPEFIAAGVNLFGVVIQGIADAIGPILDILSDAISKVIESIALALPGVALVIEAVGGSIRTALEGIASVIESVGSSIRTVFEGIASVVESVGNSIRNSLDGLAGVFDSAFGGVADIINSVGDTIKKFLDGIAGVIDSVGNAALNAGTGFQNLANGVKTITDLKLADMAASLGTVAAKLGDIAAHSDGLAEAGTGMQQIANATNLTESAFNSIASGISTVISSFYSVAEAVSTAVSSIAGQTGTLTAVGTKLVNGLVNGLKNGIGTVNAAGVDLVKACVTGLTSQISTVNSAGVKMGQALANGLKNASGTVSAAGESLGKAAAAGARSSESTFRTIGSNMGNALAQGMRSALSAVTSAANALVAEAKRAAEAKAQIKSPSRVFMTVGGYITAGFAKGIANNLGDVKKAGTNMSKTVLTATQKALGIHSPSVVFKEEVGRYIVQGIAEGIEEETDAEKAAKEKADAIVNAFNEEIDKYTRQIDNRDKDFELWQLTDGKTASMLEIANRQKQKLNDELVDYNKQVQLNTDKWKQLIDEFGENSKYVEEAYGAMRDSQIKAAEKASEIIEIDNSIIESQEEMLNNWVTINKNDLEIMELQQSNGKIISDTYKDKQYLNAYKDAWEVAKTNKANSKKYWDDMLALYKDQNHPVVQAAEQAYQEDWKTAEEAQKTYKDYIDSMNDRAIQAAEDSMSHRKDVISRWEAMYGDDASEEERYSFYRRVYNSDLDDLRKIVRQNVANYNVFVEELAEKNGLTLEEAKATKEAASYYRNKVYPALVELDEGEQKVNKLRKDRLEQQKEALKDQYETASDIADIKYQIWELTTGRDATNVEKETMKLAVLTKQLNSQAKLVDMAKDAWKNAKDDDKLKYEKEYWNARLELANLQSDVLDIQESITKRQEAALDKQRLAQDEYEDYLKRYQKYYLDHGMTLEDLERDAKLVSGYDPSTVTSAAVSKTKNSIEAIKSNVSSLMNAVSEGINDGVTDITTSTTSMLDSCSDILYSERETWFDAGADMAYGLAEGITSKVEVVVESVTDLVTRMLAAIQETVQNGLDYTTAITPVMDMSATTSNAQRAGLSLKNTSAFNLAKSIARSTANNTSGEPDETQSSAPVYSFTQNNYSPKALSSIEVYRQTNNLISRLGKRVTI